MTSFTDPPLDIIRKGKIADARVAGGSDDAFGQVQVFNGRGLELIQLGLEETNRCQSCAVPGCSDSSVPVFSRNTHPEGMAGEELSGCQLNSPDRWLRAYRERGLDAAVLEHAGSSLFATAYGWLCNHPCENNCTQHQGKVRGAAGAVNIHAVEALIGDRTVEMIQEGQLRLRLAPLNGKKVAIVGAGIAGLEAAWKLAMNGVEVHIFDKAPIMGGIVTLEIPPYKWPRDQFDVITQYMTSPFNGEQKPRIFFHPSINLNSTSDVEMLMRDYDRTIICSGASRYRSPRVKGIKEAQENGFVIEARQLTQEFNKAELQARLTGDFTDVRKLNDRQTILVVGNGLTGADCVSDALRSGADRVYVLDKYYFDYEKFKGKPNFPKALVELHTLDKGRVFSESQLLLVEPAQEGDRARLKCRIESGSNQRDLMIDRLVLAAGFTGADNELLTNFGVTFEDHGFAQADLANGVLTVQNPDWQGRVYGAGEVVIAASTLMRSGASGDRAAKHILEAFKRES